MPRFARNGSVLQSHGALLVLILLLCVIFVVQNIVGAQAYFRFMLVPANVTISCHEILAGDISNHTGPDLLTLFTYAFLHNGIGHLLGNLLFLWVFAAIAIDLLGNRWMLFTFAFTAVCGGVFHVVMAPEDPVPMLGASGAASGFAGLYLGMAVRWQLPDPSVWPIARPVPPSSLVMIAVFGLVMDLLGNATGASNIAYGAHLGGFVAGMILGGAVVPMPRVALPR
ncbi:rhomboid family intramembrane serine protease [Luteolibacter sp. AS25]|uniref:rhomboid family intramembrane serine protease n=1 Tax=Luteolibacter sp. AS25 TaxID=3135776 RepID=UPI00398B3306